jgi:hypothetical protein
MSLREIARTLYRLHQEVERLEQDLERSTATARETIQRDLVRAMAERDRMKQVLSGHLDR